MFRNSGAVAESMDSLPTLNWAFLILFRQLNSADRNCRRVESLEPKHGPDPLLHTVVILFQDIVQVFY